MFLQFLAFPKTQALCNIHHNEANVFKILNFEPLTIDQNRIKMLLFDYASILPCPSLRQFQYVHQ